MSDPLNAVLIVHYAGDSALISAIANAAFDAGSTSSTRHKVTWILIDDVDDFYAGPFIYRLVGNYTYSGYVKDWFKSLPWDFADSAVMTFENTNNGYCIRYAEGEFKEDFWDA